jgi:hypothetical protein
MDTLPATAKNPVVAGSLSGRGWPLNPAVFQPLFLFSAFVGMIEILCRWHVVARKTMHLGGDFVNLWTAARLTLQGHIATLFNYHDWNVAEMTLVPGVTQMHEWSYPPHIIPFILPLGAMPYAAAYAVWVVATFALYAFALGRGRSDAAKLAAFLLVAPASVDCILNGQNGFWVAALLAGGLRLMDKRPYAAGALFGLLTLKPQFGLMLPVVLLAARQWKPVVSGALVAAGLIGLSVALYGTGPWLNFFQVTLPHQSELLNFRWAGDIHHSFYAAMMPSIYVAAEWLGAPRAVCAALAVVFLAGAAAAVFRASRPSVPPDLRDAVVLAAALVATPYGFTYDMTLIQASVISFLLFRQGRTLPGRETAFTALIWILPALVIPLGLARVQLSPLVLAGYVFYLTRFCYTPPGRNHL